MAFVRRCDGGFHLRTVDAFAERLKTGIRRRT
jgi:hypothetical protein